MHMQAVRWARNMRHLVAMVRQCSAEVELAQMQARRPSLTHHGSRSPGHLRNHKHAHVMKTILHMDYPNLLLCLVAVTRCLEGLRAWFAQHTTAGQFDISSFYMYCALHSA